MAWEILWALVFGFFLAAIVDSRISKRQVSRLLPDAKPRSLLTATGLGVASSSCSYAAVALARALFRRGANFTAAIIFQLASTNLVIELGAILWLFIGWQFTLAEYIGGIVMIAVVAVLFRLLLSQPTIDKALIAAQEGRPGHMEGHAGMDMTGGLKAIADNFIMEWAATLRDIIGGLIMAGCVAAWVPAGFWRMFFFVHHPLIEKLWGPIIAPFVAGLTFVCSIGNVPLAGVLWNDGISFGGVVSFLFADLIIVPIVIIYRKYYGGKMTVILTFCLWLAAVVSGYIIDLMFSVMHLLPKKHTIHMIRSTHITWNYTSYLNIVALFLVAILTIVFWRTGGMPMLKMMNSSPDGDHEHHDEHVHTHAHHHHHH